ncbi:MAG: Holliday junction branch migration protein RuvA, partial [Nitrospinaceae bacterium]|nr:Holliday junction branch migration protein RuvA [Nitrospinaceae bacterium]
QVFIPLSTYYKLPESGAPVALHIHTHLREEALRLFGFLTEEEQMLFEKLITISKVGPKLALAILSGLSPQELMSAVLENNVTRLSSIPGVGRKTAERL